ncbi:MAG: hypothetical protein CME62_15560 [Halobacteriovoraceae bacterium]|nr:hypothetical protein [Halobacteriovoraceae bacterium]|tara:strand:- start:9799 stop:10374 length:576 start_codon:yes stop_codon:yes gene_type:complete
MKNLKKLFVIPMTVATLSLPAFGNMASNNEAADIMSEDMRLDRVEKAQEERDITATEGAIKTTTASVRKAELQEMDVEELLDDEDKFNGQEVTLHGEVERVIDNRTFVLESGGIINDEVVVVLEKGLSPDEVAGLIQKDQKLIVKGKFNKSALRDHSVDQELSYKGSEYETDMDKTESFVLGSEVRTQLSE